MAIKPSGPDIIADLPFLLAYSAETQEFVLLFGESSSDYDLALPLTAETDAQAQEQAQELAMCVATYIARVLGAEKFVARRVNGKRGGPEIVH